MSKYYIPNQLNLPALEQEIGAWWKQQNMFEKSMKVHEGNAPFVFYEGPPSANGLPGIHHVISRTLKDLVCRYQTMQGKPVARKAGWDTHGLPVELGVEKELGITKDDIGKTISVEEYNKKCREAVMRFKDKWDNITDKMGYWVDLKEPYVTFENDYIETLWWCLKELHKKGLLYKSVSIQPYSPAAGTGLSSHELNQPGTYKEVKDTSATVLFKVLKPNTAFHTTVSSSGVLSPDEVYLLAWTTTPWTLPSNLGLTVGAKIEYVLVETFNPYTFEKQNVILAKALLHKYFKPENETSALPVEIIEAKAGVPYKIIAEFKGADLEGIEYEQLFKFESNSVEKILEQTPDAKPFRVITGDFVTTEDGTGIVHTAPAFGADDYMVGKKNNLGILTLVDRQGKFIEGTGEYAGRFVKDYRNEANYQDVNVDISVELKKRGQAFKVEKYEHSYPHCWRTDKPIIYYPLDAWFIRTSAVKDRMVELNKTINWKPKATGEGRFGNWLENMVDWNLSRSRYWGTPLPVWRTEDGEEEMCIGTIEELKNNLHEESEIKEIADLHKPYIDKVILKSPLGKKMYREPDLIDVWFDSGAMPYAQWGIEYAEKLKAGDATAWQKFPADFIAEGVDQTRGWFYTLHALGVMLFDNVAYKAVVSNGLVLDKNGNKMSKRLGNVVDPFVTIDKYSADATRWYLVTNASPWDSLKFDELGIVEVQRKFFGTLYNTYSFFSLYANLDGFCFKEAYIPLEKREEIDRWIISSLHTLIKNVNEYFADYEPTKAGRAIQEFVDEHLSNWYVRLCRRRFWKGEYEENKIAAYQTLYECLEIVSKLMAPISPFFADWLFTNLNKVSNREDCESVHLSLFPQFNLKNINEKLEERMQLAQDICSLILSIRKKENVKVRQPLQKVLVPIVDAEMQHQIELVSNLIQSEVNVKEINYLSADDGFFNKKAKPNFKTLGAKMGTKMKEVAGIVSSLNAVQIAELEKNKSLQINLSTGQETIDLADVEITAADVPGWSMATNGSVTVALDMTLTPNLINEGNARELVNKIQKLRKDSGLELTDRIHVKLSEIEFVKDAVNGFNSYICAEILADGISVQKDFVSETVIDINDQNVSILLTKNNN